MVVESLKNTVRALRRNSFTTIKGLSFRVLRVLDPNFESNFQRAYIKIADGAEREKPAAAVPLLSSLPDTSWRAPKSIMTPLVLDTDSSVASPEAIEFLIDGIFKKPEHRALVWDAVRNSLGAGPTLTEVESIIEKHLKAQVEDVHSSAEAAECYALFLKHRLQSVSNSTAYRTAGKTKPSAVYWPDPTSFGNGRSLFGELPFVRHEPIVSKTTPVGSAGSCFASWIAHALQSKGLNYVVTEPNVCPNGTYKFMTPGNVPNSCAVWGTIFNTPSFKQLAEKAFHMRELPRILWAERLNGKPVYFDPFRENVEFPSIEAYEENYEKHRVATRESLLKCKVFIITLGLSEVWYFRADGSAFSRSPWKIAPSLVEQRILSVEDNVADLQRMLDILRVHNPDMKLIVTVSPVGLHATFRAETDHIIAANCLTKSTLRVAAEEFVNRNKGTYYFPSYELVHYCLKNPWEPDERNVNKPAVAKVMELFEAMYCES